MIKYNNRTIREFKVGAVVVTATNHYYKLEEGEHDYGVGHVVKFVLEGDEVMVAVNFVNPVSPDRPEVMHPDELIVLSQ